MDFTGSEPEILHTVCLSGDNIQPSVEADAKWKKKLSSITKSREASLPICIDYNNNGYE